MFFLSTSLAVEKPGGTQQRRFGRPVAVKFPFLKMLRTNDFFLFSTLFDGHFVNNKVKMTLIILITTTIAPLFWR